MGGECHTRFFSLQEPTEENTLFPNKRIWILVAQNWRIDKKSFKIAIVELRFEYFNILKGVGSYVYFVLN